MQHQPYISSDHINQLFYREAKKRRLPSWQLVSAALLIVAGIFFLINAPSISQQVGYWWESDIQAGLESQTAEIPFVPTDTASPNSQEPGSPAQVNGQSRTSTFDPAQLANNTIYIPKIRARAPIIWDASAGGDLNSDLLKALERGVARYPRTALPDQVGNVFLTGHSSNYWWEKGNYKTVFALLNRLVAGDVIYIKYQGTLYTYKVTGQKVVKPTETSVLAPTQTPTLSLMTCTPTGTALFRRIVTASLMSPTDNLKAQPTAPQATEIQSIR